MAVLAQQVVLGFHDAGQAAHQHAAFAGEIAVDFLLEGGGEEIAGADGDAEGKGAFLGPSGGILEDGKAGVDAAAVQEVQAHVAARALGRHQDDVDVFRRNDLGLLFVDNGKAVGEIEGIASDSGRL